MIMEGFRNHSSQERQRVIKRELNLERGRVIREGETWNSGVNVGQRGSGIWHVL